MIIRSKRTDHFTTINNIALEDDRISFRAKGVLVYLLSKPDDWRVSERQLAAVGHEGVTAIRGALKELENAGYIERRRVRAGGGRFEWESFVFDLPRKTLCPCSENLSMDKAGEAPCLGFPCVDKPCTENHPMENRSVVNTIVTNTNTLSPAREAAPQTDSAAAAQPHATQAKTVTVPADSPHMPRGLRLPGGYIPSGEGRNAVQVYYERFHFAEPDAHLNRPQEDDLARLCPDLDRLREVVTAYSRTSYRRGNVQLIIDWYRDGVPSRSPQQPAGRRKPGANKFGRIVSQEKGDSDGNGNTNGHAGSRGDLAALAAAAGVSPEQLRELSQRRRAGFDPAPSD